MCPSIDSLVRRAFFLPFAPWTILVSLLMRNVVEFGDNTIPLATPSPIRAPSIWPRIVLECAFVFLTPVMALALSRLLGFTEATPNTRAAPNNGLILSIPWIIESQMTGATGWIMFLIGACIGLWARARLRALASIATILPTLFSSLSCIEMNYYPGTHNLIPFEIAARCAIYMVPVIGIVAGKGLTWVLSPPPPRPGTCSNCRYWLVGNQSGTCPECGAACPEIHASAERPSIN